MTTFVPLAADMDGTLSAIAIGDWLLQLIKVKKPLGTQEFYDDLIGKFSLNAETKEQEISDHLSLFHLLLSQGPLVFDCIHQAQKDGELKVIVTSPDANPNQPKENDVRKTYAEMAREVEEMFGILISMLALRVPDQEKAGQAAQDLIAVARQSTTQMPELRLKLLQSLYNAFPPSFPYRFKVFRAALEYSAEANIFHLMVPYIQYIDEWMKDWHLSSEDKRSLFLLTAREFKKLNRLNESYPLLRRHVEAFQGEKELLSQSCVSEVGAELAADSIRLPHVMYFDELLEIDAIKMLESGKFKDLHRLLQIYRRHGPREFMEFHAAHPEIFEQHQLDKDECLNKIRLLSVASCCLDGSTKKLLDMGDSLGLTDAYEIEEIVVQAIGQGLLDAKIIQTEGSVEVKSSMHREFGTSKWEYLRKRLIVWQESVAMLQRLNAEAKAAFPGDRQPVY